MSHALCIVSIDAADMARHKTVEKAVEFEMRPFDENGHWFKKGSRWDWYQIGGRFSGGLVGKDIALRSELTDDAIAAYAASRADETWHRWQAEPRKDDPFIRDYCYGIEADETLAMFTQRLQAKRISAYSFLRQRRWQENGRMGWFGTTAKTECEVSDGHQGVCLYEHTRSRAKVVSFNHDEDVWGQKYFDRFIKDLAPDSTLVAVDYHV